MELQAGANGREQHGESLPDETIEALRTFRVGIKGPLTTPVGTDFRSLNTALRRKLNLYANVRTTYNIEGVPSPVSRPEKMNIVNFRENKPSP